MKIIYEVHIKNLYNNTNKKYKKFLTLDSMFKFNAVDPTSDIKRPEVAGSFLGWIVRDYFDRVYPKVSIENYVDSDFANEVTMLLDKFLSLKRRDLTTYTDVYKYSFSDLSREISSIEQKFGLTLTNKVSKGRDYDILLDNSSWTVYNIKSPNGSVYFGKHTKWCISKDNQFILDVRQYLKQNYKIFFVKNKKEKNSAKNKDSELMFPSLPEFYGIIVTPENEFLEIVNSDNQSLFYTSDYEKIATLLKEFL